MWLLFQHTLRFEGFGRLSKQKSDNLKSGREGSVETQLGFKVNPPQDDLVEAYVAKDATQARELEAIFASKGIFATVVGESLHMGAGELPMLGHPSVSPCVWVRQEDLPFARKLVAEYEAEYKLALDHEDEEPWDCSGCGEQNEPTFGICWSCQTVR